MAGSSRSLQQVETRAAQQVPRPRQLRASDGHQALAVALEAAEQPAHAAAGDLHAQVDGGDVLQMVRLVEHQPLVGRQHRGFLPVVLGLAHREIGREQVMVHHHDVGLGGVAAGRKRKQRSKWGHLTRVQRSASALTSSQTSLARLDRQVAQRAVGGVAGPLGQQTSSSCLSGSSRLRCAPVAWCSRERQR